MAYPVKKRNDKKIRHRLTVVEADSGRKKSSSKVRKTIQWLRLGLALGLIFGLSILVISRYELIKSKSRALAERETLIKLKEGERDYQLQLLAPYICEKVIEEKATVHLGMSKPRKDQIVHIHVEESIETTQDKESLKGWLRAFFARIKKDGEGM